MVTVAKFLFSEIWVSHFLHLWLRQKNISSILVVLFLKILPQRRNKDLTYILTSEGKLMHFCVSRFSVMQVTGVLKARGKGSWASLSCDTVWLHIQEASYLLLLELKKRLGCDAKQLHQLKQLQFPSVFTFLLWQLHILWFLLLIITMQICKKQC